jgi:hypothetical protein
MSNNQNPRSASEDAWIVKYRAALDAIPAPQTRGQKLQSVFSNACAFVIAKAATTFGSWFIGAQLSPKSKFVPRPAIRPPERQAGPAILLEEGVSKKAS